MYEDTDRFQNWFITSLQTSITDTTNSFRLNKALDVNQCRLVIDPYDDDLREIVEVTSVDGDLVYVNRGDDHTDPQYHQEGAIVALHVFAADMNDLYADWAEMQVNLQEAADAANDAAAAAIDATSDATGAAALADAATAAANTATTNANNATTAANTATTNANTATTNANAATTAANDAADNANDAAADAEAISASIIAGAFLGAHPVGAIYLSVVSTNPGTLYGGTWVAWGAGRVPVGVDTGQTEFDTVEETGGEKSVTLTANQSGLRAHNHPPSSNARFGYYDNTTSQETVGEISGSGWNILQTTGSVGSGTTTGNNAAANASEAHTNLQPYITVYMWKRTA